MDGVYQTVLTTHADQLQVYQGVLLTIAAKAGHAEMVDLLLDEGANINGLGNEKVEEVLHVIARTESLSSSSVVILSLAFAGRSDRPLLGGCSR